MDISLRKRVRLSCPASIASALKGKLRERSKTGNGNDVPNHRPSDSSPQSGWNRKPFDPRIKGIGPVATVRSDTGANLTRFNMLTHRISNNQSRAGQIDQPNLSGRIDSRCNRKSDSFERPSVLCIGHRD